eukprot:scaffold49508_cov47-Cyclotella_meneghiniana.AAC.1
MESCAACGKAEVSLKSCRSCKLVKYCGVDCQVSHRSAHKKACRNRAAELLFDLKLFADPPRREECVICCIPMPFKETESTYMTCCGKTICCGCRCCLPREHCPFCNAGLPRSDEERNRRLFERIEKYNDPEAISHLGHCYTFGTNGLPLDHGKAIELFQRASQLGHAGAHYRLALAYFLERGVQLDRKKAKKAIHHCHIAAMMGHLDARCRLGVYEGLDGNHDRSLRHFMIAARGGHDESLGAIKNGYMKGWVTKEDFEKILREHKASQDETKSDQRDRARAARGL